MAISLTQHTKRISPEQWFMVSALIVNGGNYLYNLLLGRILGPTQFADAAILITVLLVLSFVAMTFQLAVAKFSLHFTDDQHHKFIQWAYRLGIGIGIVLGLGMVLNASGLQSIFQTESKVMFIIFGCAAPLYFLMSINRGRWQGEQSFVALAMTYQLEMFARLGITLVLLLLFQSSPAISVALGMGLSFIAGFFPYKKIYKAVTTVRINTKDKKLLLHFLLCTAFYELTQIICNNSDILLVKHYFPQYEAGLYAALALIGRVVYFVTWMVIMVLLPKVIALKKEGKPTHTILMTYCTYISVFAGGIVAFTFLFPAFAVQLLFGEAYLSIAPLLGWYALATALFAISNIFAYYFLSLDRYIPVALGAFGGVLQVILICYFHTSLYQVVLMQVIAMGILCALQLGYFFFLKNK